MSSMSSRNRAIVRYTNDTNGAGSSRDGARCGDDTQSDSSGAKHRSDKQIESEDIERIVSYCVKYLLISDHKKTPVKRSDLLKSVSKQTLNRKTVEEIIEKIRTHLSDAFAIELAECPETPNTYILINKLPANGLKEAINSNCVDDSQLFQTGLLTSVLSVIFMSGETSHEDIVWKFLTKLGFNTNSKTKTIQINNESNGFTIRKLLTEVWVRQMYLKYQKIPRTDPIAHEFKWGFRAEKEFSKLDILKFVCDIFGDGSQPESWRTQYTSAQQNRPSNDENEVEVIV